MLECLGSKVKFVRLDPKFEVDVRAIDLTHVEISDKYESNFELEFYELDDFYSTYSFVATHNQKVIGYGLLNIFLNAYGFQKALVVDKISVDKSVCGKGIANAIFNNILKIAKNTEVHAIILQVPNVNPATEHLIKKWDMAKLNSLHYYRVVNT